MSEEKVALYVKSPSKWPVLILSVLLLGMTLLLLIYHRKNTDLERQLSGHLTEKEKELQSANAELNRVRAELAHESKLREELEKTSGLNLEELKKMQKKYDLLLDGVARIQANLHGNTSGGSASTTNPSPGVIQFEWWDKYRRFHILVPNIYGDPNEIRFDYAQRFSINAVLYRQKPEDGGLRVLSASLLELDREGNTIGTATLDLDNSHFTYSSMASQSQRTRNTINIGMTSNAEALVMFEPFRFRKDTLGFGTGVYGNKDSVGIGLTAQWYPKLGWVHSEVGVGALIGYNTDSKTQTRVFVSVPIGSIHK